jgi:hypothetical protein
MANILRNLKINEVSSVDRGANGGARIMLYKRDDDGDDTPLSPGTQYLHELAGLVSTATNRPYQDALNYLLHSQHGRALATTFKRDVDMETTKMDNRGEVLVQKYGSVRRLAEDINKRGDSPISEPELVALITQEQKVHDPDLSDAAAFAKAFTRDLTLQRAISIARATPLPSDLDANLRPQR